MKMLEKSTPPVTTPIGGMMMSSTSDLTMVEKAAPMMMPTAMSMTLPRSANSLNSFNIAAFPLKTFSSQWLKPLACHVWASIQTRR